MAILEVKDLKKSFGDAEVLKGISFSLEEKNVLAIIGSSGSGKQLCCDASICSKLRTAAR